MFDTKSLKFEWIRDCNGHLSCMGVQERIRDYVTSLEIMNVTPELQPFSSDFVLQFLLKSGVNLLRIEECDICLNDLIKLIEVV